MNEASGNSRDNSGAVVRPPIAWAIAVIAGLALDRLYPLPFVPATLPAYLTAECNLMPVASFNSIMTFRRPGSQEKPVSA